jgi:hypothetical protein
MPAAPLAAIYGPTRPTKANQGQNHLSEYVPGTHAGPHYAERPSWCPPGRSPAASRRPGTPVHPTPGTRGRDLTTTAMHLPARLQGHMNTDSEGSHSYLDRA